MDEDFSVPANAAMGGFLQGICYLNRDRRSDFAEAFVVDAPDVGQFSEYIQTHFSQLPG